MIEITEIPLKKNNQEMNILLSGTVYHLIIKHNEYCGWVLDVMSQAKTPILTGIPIVYGVDILEQYQYIGINGVLVFYCDDPESEKEQSELGRKNRIYFAQNN